VLPLPLSGKAGRAVAVASRTEPRVVRKTKKGETFMLFSIWEGRRRVCEKVCMNRKIGERLYRTVSRGLKASLRRS
jgi:hypothetical protein